MKINFAKNKLLWTFEFVQFHIFFLFIFENVIFSDFAVPQY